MSLNGYLISGQCVQSSDGISPMNLAISNFPFVIQYPYPSVNSAYIYDGSPSVISLTPSLMTFQFNGWDVAIGGDIPIVESLQGCDTQQFPISAHDVLFPDIGTAVILVASIWAVWTVGFGVRMLIRTIGTSSNDDVDT